MTEDPPAESFRTDEERSLDGALTHAGAVSSVNPTDVPSEERWLCCCLLGGQETTAQGLELVTPAHFFDEEIRRGYLVLAKMVGKPKEINIPTFLSAWDTTFAEHSSKSILARVSNVIDNIPSQSMVVHYAEELVETAKRRRLFRMSYGILASVPDKTRPVDAILADAEAQLMTEEIASVPYYGALACANALVDDLHARHARQGAPTGILSGLHDLDAKTDGLQSSEMVVLAARPGIGKTAIGLCIAHKACIQNLVPTLVVTLEMNKEALLRRLTAIHCGIDMFTLRKGNFSDADFPKIAAFTQSLNAAPFHVLDAVGGADDQELAAVMRRKIKQHGIKLVIVDYLQKIWPSRRNEKRTYEVAQVSGTLKAVTSRCGVAMIALAQINRESEKNKGALPKLADLADSAQIERDADVVLLLHRNRDETPHEATLFIAKNRDGENGMIPLLFEGRFCRFVSKSKIADEDIPPCAQQEFNGQSNDP